MKNSIYVITGGPGCEKTTIGAELFKEGYLVLPEIARTLIAENKKNGGPLPWTDFEGFQRAIMSQQKSREDAVCGLDEIIFSDRGMSDTMAYYYANKKYDIPTDIMLQMHRHKYAGVFILNPLPDYKTDAQRVESPEFARHIHDHMLGAYLVTGHQPVFVPVLPVAERVKFILDYIYKPNREVA